MNLRRLHIDPQLRHHLRRIVRAIFRYLPFFLAGIALIGTLVRFTLRDRFPVLSAFYYTTPPILLAIAFLLAAGGWWFHHRRRIPASLSCLAGVLLLFWWFATAWYFPAEQVHASTPFASSPPIRVLYWNIGRGAMGYSRIFAKIKSHAPDLIALNEAGRDPARTARLLADNFPGFQVSRLDGGMVVLVRGTLNEPDPMRSTAGSRCRLFQLAVHGQPLTLVTVDMVSNLLASRKAGFTRLATEVAPHLNAPLLVTGDFNTPTDSIYLAPLREKLFNGFEHAGCGYSGTWPTFLPVQAIDQVWFNRLLNVAHYRLESTFLSDHRLVSFELEPALAASDTHPHE